MVQVELEGKKVKLPAIVAREGPFILVRRLTKFPKRAGIEFVVKRETRFGRVLVSSNITGKTKAQGMQLLRAAVESEKLLKQSVQAAKQAGMIVGRGVIAAGRIGFRLTEKASRPNSRARKKTRSSIKKTTKRKKRRKR